MNVSQKPFTLWFTGLPCSGKTTLATLVTKELRTAGLAVKHLDGDQIRKEISKDLGFSKEDRCRNVGRVSGIAAELNGNGVIAVVSMVSPYRKMREEARKKIYFFIEVYLSCPVTVCEERDVKGFYAEARRGKISNFTGVSDPYEEPLSPELSIQTHKESVQVCKKMILNYLSSRDLLPASDTMVR